MKKIYKTMGVITLMLALLLPSMSFAMTGFNDIEDSSYQMEIKSLQEKGILKGTSALTFKPHKNLTFAEGITLINATFGLNLDLIRFIKEPKATDYFVNADDDAWYAQALIIASVHGVGFKETLIPSDGIDKETFVSLLVTYAELKYDLPMVKLIPLDIKDSADMNPENDGAIQRALSYGLIELDDAGQLNPKSILHREEAAQIIYNLIQYLELKERI